MILIEGPHKKSQFKKRIESDLGKKKTIFLLMFFLLPLLVIVPFKLNWLTTGFNSSGDYKSVAKILLADRTGSAFLISPTKLITAKHVIEDMEIGDEVNVVFEKSEPKIELVAKIIFMPNDDIDFAILELDKPLTSLSPLPLGDDNGVNLNDEVTIVGYPNTWFSSAKSQIINNEFQENLDLFLLSGGAWPGNSGGPIINSKTKEVIGVLILGGKDDLQGVVAGLKISKIKENKELLKSKINIFN